MRLLEIAFNAFFDDMRQLVADGVWADISCCITQVLSLDAMQAAADRGKERENVMIGLVTSTQDALTCAPRAEEVKEVTAMLGWLQVKKEDLALFKGNWAYHKSSPSPDDLPSPMHSTIEDVLPEEWDKTLNPQETEEEPEGEPLNSGQKALIARIVSCALISEE